MSRLSISLINAAGMLKQSIYPILQLAQNSDLLFLTETWLLSNEIPLLMEGVPYIWLTFGNHKRPLGTSWSRLAGESQI